MMIWWGMDSQINLRIVIRANTSGDMWQHKSSNIIRRATATK